MFISQSLPGFAPLQMSQPSHQSAVFQMALMTQMMNLMMSIFSMVSGLGFQGSPMSMGNPGFGGGQPGFGSAATPADFLGSSGSTANAGGASSSAPVGDAKSVGGGFVSPVDNYKITSRFGPRKAPTAGASTNHRGIDLAAPLNTPIRAAKAGKVTVSKDEASGYGKWIEIQHADGTKTRYAHLNSRDVQVGSQVQAGQVIGKMGSTGTSTGSHLHFEVLDKSGRQVNPEQVMKL